MADDEEEALRDRPELEAARQVARERPRPFMRRIAVQVEMQLRARHLQRLVAGADFIERFVAAVFQVAAEGGVARGMMHMTRIALAEPSVQGIAVRVLDGNIGDVGLRIGQQPAHGPQGADGSRGLVGMLAAGDENRRTRSRPVDAAHGAPLAGDALEGFAGKSGELAMDLRETGRGIGRLDVLLRPHRIRRHAERAQGHAHMRIALAGADVRHDLARLHAAILGRAARPALEEFEQREIEILVQRLARAHDLVAVIERALDPGDRHIDGKRFRIGFALGPAMRGDRIHDLVKDLLDLRLERLVEIGADIGAAASPSAIRSA